MDDGVPLPVGASSAVRAPLSPVLRHHGHRAGGVVQCRVAHPPELEAEVAVPSPGADDQEGGVGRQVQEDLAGGAFHDELSHLDVRVLAHRVVQGFVEQRGGA